MNHPVMSRRAFLQTTALAGTALAAGACHTMAAPSSWSIGCFNRPWMQKFGSRQQPLDTPQPANWGIDGALKGIQEAGYHTVGLLTPMPEEPFIGSQATGEYLTTLKGKIAASGLTANMGSLRVKPELPLEEAIADTRRQIDHARFLKLEWLLTFGVDNREYYEKYYQMMSDAADYAQAAKIKLVMKPHGGSSGTAEEIQRCLARVNRPNFKIWYDAGNIVYYDGKDPVEELKPIAQYVTGFCAKDCDRERGRRDDPIWHGQSGFRRGLRGVEEGRIQRPHFCGMRGRKDIRGGDRRREGQPAVPGKCVRQALINGVAPGRFLPASATLSSKTPFS